jgi:hypothetical protein
MQLYGTGTFFVVFSEPSWLNLFEIHLHEPVIGMRRVSRPLNHPFLSSADCVPGEMAVRATFLLSKNFGEGVK